MRWRTRCSGSWPPRSRPRRWTRTAGATWSPARPADPRRMGRGPEVDDPAVGRPARAAARRVVGAVDAAVAAGVVADERARRRPAGDDAVAGVAGDPVEADVARRLLEQDPRLAA